MFILGITAAVIFLVCTVIVFFEEIRDKINKWFFNVDEGDNE